MATRERRTRAPRDVSSVVLGQAEKLSRPFLPTLDFVEGSATVVEELSDQDKQRIVSAKIADVTHFRVGLDVLRGHMNVALDLAVEMRALPSTVRGILVNKNDTPAARVSVQPEIPSTKALLGRGALTDETGTFELALPTLPDAQRGQVIAEGLGFRVTGDGAVAHVRVDAPAADQRALGEIRLDVTLKPLPRSIVGALIDLVDDLPSVTGPEDAQSKASDPVRIQIGQGACNIVFEQDATLRRFPYKILVRLIEPRTTTLNKVFLPVFTGKFPIFVPDFGPNFGKALDQTNTQFVERVPVDKPISVDGFRDQLIGVENNTIVSRRAVPMAGTLGLGYVLNLAQVWNYDGLTLGNLLYSLPLAPGEQQRVAASERVATAAVSDFERLDIAEQQRSSLREDTSAQATFDSAFEEHVNAGTSYRNDARSSSWGVAGGVGAVLGPVAIGIGAGGGGGSSSNSGSTRSALDGVRTFTSGTSEDMHRSVERQASARRSAQRTSIRLATETDRQTVTTKVVTNHNKAHALTVQYWEVLRKFTGTTEIEGVNLVCFVPLDLVRFLPAGQKMELDATTAVDTRAELLVRYALLHRHADSIQPNLPGRHREGLRLLEDFAANIRAGVDVSATAAASDVLNLSLTGKFLPYERLWIDVLVRGGRRIGPVRMDSPLTAIAPRLYGTGAEFLGELRRLRREGDDTKMSAAVTIPEPIDKSEVIGFEIRRAFDTIDYQLDPAKNPLFPLLSNPALAGLIPGLPALQNAFRLTPAELERDLGGPMVHDFVATFGASTDSIAADRIAGAIELPPGALPLAAVERNPVLGFRDLMKIERTLQHVVRNTLTYSKAVWSSLTAEERVVMLEAYTIGLPEAGLPPEAFGDPSQHVPLLNCVANQVLGYYGNCMIMPFSIPPSLAVLLAGENVDGRPEPALTNGAVQDALTRFHKDTFSPPKSHFTLPTRGVLGEAVLGHCPSAEKIDITRFWNWQDSPADEATAIAGAALTASTVAQLQAPAALANTPSIIANVAGSDAGGLTPGALVKALIDKSPAQADFATEFLAQNLAATLGGKTIDSAEAARKDALASATSLADKALSAGVDVFKTKLGVDDKKAAEAKAAETKAEADKATAAKAKADRQEAAVKDLKENVAAYLGAADNKGDAAAAKAFAEGIIKGLAGGELPSALAAKLFAAFDKKATGGTGRTQGSEAFLAALGLN